MKERQVLRSERPTPSPDEVARRAYELFEARGCQPGHDLENWLDAERELSDNAQSRTADLRRHRSLDRRVALTAQR